jgi:subtilisin family serine protease
MCLGGGASTAVDSAVKRLIDSGVTVAVAAGNGNQAGIAQDACKTSPARVSAAITVSATDSADKKTSWANYGNCVDWFAPGLNITSDWWTSNTATNTISGTSMATPHPPAAAALYPSENVTSTPQQVRDGLFGLTVRNVVKQAKSANANLLQVGTL